MIIEVQGKKVGNWDSETNTFWKSVSGKLHLMRVLDAWGIDEELMQKLLKYDAKIIVTDRDDGQVYETDAKTYQDYGLSRDFGFGAQLFLPRDKFVQRKSRVDEILKEKVVNYQE